MKQANIARFILLLSLCTAAFNVSAQSDTTITYQGELMSGGSPANGDFPMSFSLWDALEMGSQMGATEVIPNVNVSDGIFTVELDFGADALGSGLRWLEIDVDGNILVPRQAVNRSPFSIQTRGIFVNDARQVGIGETSPLTALHLEQSDLGMDGDAISTHDLIVEDDSDAAIGIYSNTLGTYGSAITLGEVFMGSLTSQWAIVRGTSDGDAPLFITFGADPNYTQNPVVLRLEHSGQLKVGPQEVSLPVAYGSVDVDGNIIAATSNVSIGTEPNSAVRRIALSTHTIDASYTVLVTAIDSPAVAWISTVSGEVSMTFHDPTDLSIETRPFNFAIYAPP